MNYDIIITGTGCAGLSFVYFLMKSKLKDKSILIIDQEEEKNTNDKTWCYWSQDPLELHPKNNIVAWQQIQVASKEYASTNNLKKLRYFHIHSLDFYNNINNFLKDFPNITRLNDEVLKINSNSSVSSNGCEVLTKNNGVIKADKIINSIPDLIDPEPLNCIHQIFVGWTIKTDKPVFDKKCAQLMKFNHLNQDQVNFIYILPFSEDKALIEFTLFSKQKISIDSLETKLKEYIETELNIEGYSISSIEKGKIPMTNKLRKNRNEPNIFHIGTAGGCTKASTGYTFYNIQKQVKEVVRLLENQEDFLNYKVLKSKRFIFYDNIILNIIQKWPKEASKIFSLMFAKNDHELIFKFLNEETNFLEELNILRKLPLKVCIKSLLNYEKY